MLLEKKVYCNIGNVMYLQEIDFKILHTYQILQMLNNFVNYTVYVNILSINHQYILNLLKITGIA